MTRRQSSNQWSMLNKSRVWSLYLVSFLVGLRTYQRPLASQNTPGILQVLCPLLPQKTRLQNSLEYTVMFKQSVCCGLRMISHDLFNEGFRTEQALLLVVTVFEFLNIIFSVFAVMEHCVVFYLLFKTYTGICRSGISKRTRLIAHSQC